VSGQVSICCDDAAEPGVFPRVRGCRPICREGRGRRGWLLDGAREQLGGLGGVLDEADVFEAALDLAPFAALEAVGRAGVVEEPEVLEPPWV